MHFLASFVHPARLELGDRTGAPISHPDIRTVERNGRGDIETRNFKDDDSLVGLWGGTTDAERRRLRRAVA